MIREKCPIRGECAHRDDCTGYLIDEFEEDDRLTCEKKPGNKES